MNRKELLAVLILAALVGLVAFFRVVQMPPNRIARPRPGRAPPSKRRPKPKASASASISPRLIWPHPWEDYLPKQPEARSLFDAAERIMSEAYVAASEAGQDTQLFAAAIPIYRRFIARYEDEPTVEVARFRIAQSLTLSERYADAALAYDLFLEKHPGSQFRAMALLWSGDSHLHAGNREVARKRFQEVIAEGPALLAKDAKRRLERMAGGKSSDG